MIGSNVAGWTVTAAISGHGDVHTYAVQHGDGRVGVLEIAAANTAGAAALVHRAQTMPAGAVLDRGLDPFGNPFLVTPPQPAPAPAPAAPAPAPFDPFAAPPPPSQPQPGPLHAQPRAGAGERQVPRIPGTGPDGPSNLKRNALVVGGIGVAAVIVVALTRGGGGEAPPEAQLPLTADAHWGYRCNEGLTINGSTGPHALIDVLGETVSADSYGDFSVTIAADTLGERSAVTVGASLEGYAEAETPIEIPERRTHAPLTNPRILGDTMSLHDASVSVRVAEGEATVTELGPSFGTGDDHVPEGHAYFVFDACNLRPQRSSDGAVATIVEEAHARLEIDIAALLWSAPGATEPEQLHASADLTTTSGETVEVTLTMETPSLGHGAYDYLGRIADEPLANAPLPADVAAPRPIVALWNGNLVREYLGEGAPADAPYVAVFETDDTRVGMCGPYGYLHDYAKKYRQRVNVTLYEARTGKVVAKRRFQGPYPRCPDSIMIYNGEPNDVHGDLPDKQVDRWIDRYRG